MARRERRMKMLEKRTAFPRDQPAKPACRIESKVPGGEGAAIYFYTHFGHGGIEAEKIAPQIDAIDAGHIDIYINSPGGDVFEARAVRSALDRHPASIHVHIDALAASAASYVMLAGDEISIAPGAMIMIHRAWGLALGNAEEMRATAGLLEKIDGLILDDYEKATGLERSRLEQMMDDESWMDASEAVDLGFCHAVEDEDEGQDAGAAARRAMAMIARARFDYSGFSHAPEALNKVPAAADEFVRQREYERHRRRAAARLKWFEIAG